jgi:hypothetical protein
MFTKAEVAKLPVEQQEILAQIELSKARHRQKLLELARGLDWRSRCWPLYFFAIFMAFGAFYYFNFFHVQDKPAILYLFAGISFVNGLFIQISRLDRRVTALLELLDFDRQNQDDSNNSKDEKAD